MLLYIFYKKCNASKNSCDNDFPCFVELLFSSSNVTLNVPLTYTICILNWCLCKGKKLENRYVDVKLAKKRLFSWKFASFFFHANKVASPISIKRKFCCCCCCCRSNPAYNFANIVTYRVVSIVVFGAVRFGNYNGENPNKTCVPNNMLSIYFDMIFQIDYWLLFISSAARCCWFLCVSSIPVSQKVWSSCIH